MRLDILCQLVLMFFVYGFLGWACECLYCSIPAKKFINRGFLLGPICPVYGIGALLVIGILSPISGDIGILFVFGMLVTSVLEYITSFLLEKLFHMKWWDYSKKPYNIHGRVCLLNSVLFGVLCVLLMRGLHPRVLYLLHLPSMRIRFIMAFLLLCLFAIDLMYSIHAVLQLNGRLRQLHNTLEEIRKKSALRRVEWNEKLKALRHKQFMLEHAPSFTHRRLLTAFPHLHSLRYKEEAKRLRRALEQIRRQKKQGGRHPVFQKKD